MKWRLLNLNWKYALGELAIVTLGVLFALYIEQWNSNRLDRIEEIEILERLISDLMVDLDEIENGEGVISNKIPALQRLANYNNNPNLIAGKEKNVIDDLSTGAYWGWDQNVTRTATYTELIGTGNFGLIRNADLRNQLSNYYDDFDSWARRIEERETAFPALSYRLAPNENNPREMSEMEIERTIRRVMDSDIQEHILAEENFAFFASQRLKDMRDSNESMLEALEEYLGY